MPVDLFVVCLGTGLAALTLGRGIHARREARVQLRLAASSANPHTRAAAIKVMGAQGLRRYAAVLVERVDNETDIDVLASLVEVVQRNAWEPADHPALIELRLWAADWSAQ
jgi:hypothetical protein